MNAFGKLGRAEAAQQVFTAMEAAGIKANVVA